jgi:integrase
VATYRKRGKTWRVELYVRGKREGATFHTKAEAVAWANMRESELVGGKLPDKTLADALDRYGREKAPKEGGGERWTRNKIANLKTYPIARRPLVTITGPDIAEWRDARLAGPRIKGAGSVQPSTVNREMNLLRSVLEAARKDWGWLRSNPMADVSRPKNPKSRRRRITDDEATKVCTSLGYVGGEAQTASQRVAVAFLFALETAMRGGEIVRIRPRDVRTASVHLPKTKNGDARDVPLSKRARELLKLLPPSDPVFGLTDAQKDSLFRKGRDASGVDDLHFHDSRAEAIWRLSKKLDVLELARVIGHRDLKSLLIYYETTADELAKKLD